MVKNPFKSEYSLQLKEITTSVATGKEVLKDIGRDVWEGTILKKFREAFEAAQDEALEKGGEYPQFHEYDHIQGKVYIVPVDEFTMNWVVGKAADWNAGYSVFKAIRTKDVAKAALLNVVTKTAALPDDLLKAWKRTVLLSGLPLGETSYVKKEVVDTRLTKVVFACSKNALEHILKADSTKRRHAGDINFGGKDLTVCHFRQPVTSVKLDQIKFNYDV